MTRQKNRVKIAGTLNDEKKTKEMALEGKKLIEMFSIDNSIKALNEIYEAEGLFERKDKNS